MKDKSEEHKHNSENNLCRQFISNAAKRKATEDISKRPVKLVREKVKTVPDFIRQNLTKKDIKLARRSCYTIRRSIFPPLPTNIQEVHEALEKINTSCVDGDNILLVNDKINNIVIFCARQNLEYLCSLVKAYMDGTFKNCFGF